MMDTATYPNKDVVEFSKDAVFVMCHSGQTHGEVEVQVRNGRQVETKTVCKKYPNMRCDDHLKMRQAANAYTQGIRGIPSHVVLGPDLKELARHSGYMAPGEFVKFVQEHQKTLGPSIPGRYWAGFQAMFQKAEELLAEGEPGKAWKEYDKALKNAKKFEALAASIESKQAELLETGREAVEEATGLEAEASKARLKELLDAYRGSPLEKEIKAAIAGLGQ